MTARNSVYALALLSAGISHAAGPDPGYFTATCSPTNGAAPLTITVSGYVDSGHPSPVGPFCVFVQVGDRTESSYCEWANGGGVDFDFELAVTLPCPGEYRVRTQADFFGPCPPCDWIEWTVTVDEPAPLSLAAVCDPNGTSCSLFADAPRFGHIVRSMVEWGDGTPPQEFAWASQGEWYAGPSHDFGQSGYFAVRITNEIEGAGGVCSEVSGINVNPGYTTPVAATTWGRIKALYAR